MRYVLKSTSEAMHYWANKVQSEGKASSVFFDSDKIYSYGRHFCIARHLPGGAVAITTRRYSMTTSQHVAGVRGSVRHLHRVYCNDPSEGATQNKVRAQSAIDALLHETTMPRKLAKTIERLKAEALGLAIQFNDYLAALPPTEQIGVLPFDVSGVDQLRESIARMAAEREATIKAQIDARKVRALEALKAWRGGTVGRHSYLHDLPPALRLAYRERYLDAAGHQVIETSHGAEIPVSDALKLWPIVQRVMQGTKDYEPGEPLGVYRLTRIRTNGSIVVGCHDIAFSELEAIAQQLGLIEALEAA